MFNLVLLFAGPALVLSSHVALPFFCGHFGAEVEVEKPSFLSRVFRMFRLPRRRESEETPSGGILGSVLAYVGKTWAWGNFWIPTALFVPSVILHVFTTKVLLSVNRYVSRHMDTPEFGLTKFLPDYVLPTIHRDGAEPLPRSHRHYLLTWFSCNIG